ncbi:MAG: hypothetical protein HFI64_08000 [Lachnospiraceae bacterium]|nr:hypothetical protein [Lachnospiraceae bacterium]
MTTEQYIPTPEVSFKKKFQRTDLSESAIEVLETKVEQTEDQPNNSKRDIGKELELILEPEDQIKT